MKLDTSRALMNSREIHVPHRKHLAWETARVIRSVQPSHLSVYAHLPCISEALYQKNFQNECWGRIGKFLILVISYPKWMEQTPLTFCKNMEL